MTTAQSPLGSVFDHESTAAEVLASSNLTGRTAIVTGGASGIGLETTRALALAGAEVLALVRNVPAAREALADLAGVEVESLDLADPASIDRFAYGFVGSGRALDILINNAGVMFTPFAQDDRGFETHFATNHLGHFQLAVRLWPALRMAGGARVVSLSSRGHRYSPVDFDDPNFERRPYDKVLAYGQSQNRQQPPRRGDRLAGREGRHPRLRGASWPHRGDQPSPAHVLRGDRKHSAGRRGGASVPQSGGFRKDDPARRRDERLVRRQSRPRRSRRGILRGLRRRAARRRPVTGTRRAALRGGRFARGQAVGPQRKAHRRHVEMRDVVERPASSPAQACSCRGLPHRVHLRSDRSATSCGARIPRPFDPQSHFPIRKSSSFGERPSSARRSIGAASPRSVMRSLSLHAGHALPADKGRSNEAYAMRRMAVLAQPLPQPASTTPSPSPRQSEPCCWSYPTSRPRPIWQAPPATDSTVPMMDILQGDHPHSSNKSDHGLRQLQPTLGGSGLAGVSNFRPRAFDGAVGSRRRDHARKTAFDLGRLIAACQLPATPSRRAARRHGARMTRKLLSKAAFRPFVDQRLSRSLAENQEAEPLSTWARRAVSSSKCLSRCATIVIPETGIDRLFAPIAI